MRQPDEEAILEVAREIRNLDVRAKYLSQVCPDQAIRLRLEQKCKGHRRWQFGLRSLLAVMVVGAVLSTGLAMSYQQALMAEQARRQAIAARQAAMQLTVEQQAASSEEVKP